MPHSIIHRNACFAYFNKMWGIPTASVGLRSKYNQFEVEHLEHNMERITS